MLGVAGETADCDHGRIERILFPADQRLQRGHDPRAQHDRVAGRLRIGAMAARAARSEEHTSELQSLMRISYAVFCLTKKNIPQHNNTNSHIHQSPTISTTKSP